MSVHRLGTYFFLKTRDSAPDGLTAAESTAAVTIVAVAPVPALPAVVTCVPAVAVSSRSGANDDGAGHGRGVSGAARRRPAAARGAADIGAWVAATVPDARARARARRRSGTLRWRRVPVVTDAGD